MAVVTGGKYTFTALTGPPSGEYEFVLRSHSSGSGNTSIAPEDRSGQGAKSGPSNTRRSFTEPVKPPSKQTLKIQYEVTDTRNLNKDFAFTTDGA